MKKIFLAALAATTLFASCAKEGGNATPEGEKTRMGLSFSFSGAETRAINDAYATDDEKKAVDITVFIFDTNGAAVTPGNGTTLAINATNFTETNNLYTLKDAAKIETTTGARKVYVGMNLPADMKTITSEATLKTAMAVDLSKLAPTTGMAMFSTAVSEVNLVLDETENVVPVTVERMVAKVGASYKAPLTSTFTAVGGADFTITKFGIGQDGKKMYPIKQYNSAGKQVTPGELNKVPLTATWKDVSPNDATALTLNSYYIGENISPENLRGEVTYAVFQARFAPVNWTKTDGTTEGGDGTPVTTYVVKADEGIFYCKDATIAAAVKGLKTNATVALYTGGYCYYTVYLNSNKGARKYEVYRNDFIHLEVEGLAGLGTPGDPAKGGEEPDPNEPTDPELPVDNEPTNLFVNVTVKAWEYGTLGITLQ